MTTPLIVVADNLQITNPVIAKALEKEDPKPIVEIVKMCVEKGAQAIDINSGPLTKTPEKMAFLVDVVQDVTDLPILLDTSNPKALEAGLTQCRNKTIINGFSLEPEKLKYILPLAKKYNTQIIGYLLYPNSHVPSDETGRMNVALQLFEEFQKMDMAPDQLIIDPIIAPVLWENGNQQDMGIISLIRNLPDLLGFEVATIAGISNLTSGKGPKPKKKILEASFTGMLAGAGLHMALMNMLHHMTLDTIRACNALSSEMIFAWDAV
ncbi:MAG: dihydropteroate synthase [Desulfobacteraceae bacterium]|nr:dihydropteroate synthase [Desulfobacteraceae bacterium]